MELYKLCCKKSFLVWSLFAALLTIFYFWTELGRVQEAVGGGIYFAYAKGWKAFLDTLQTGMVFANILIVFGISTVFSQESQTRMRSLLFTAQEGQGRDVWAKIAAAFTLAIMVYGAAAFFAVGLSAWVFGMEGGECPLSIALSRQGMLDAARQVSYMPVASFAGTVAKWDLVSCLFLCAITMCVSAHCRSNFGAVAMAALLWGTPLGVRLFFGELGYFISSCMPVFLIMTDSVYESLLWGQEEIMYAFIFPLSAICVEEGYQVYRRRQQP